MNPLVVRRSDARALLVRSDTPTLDGALRPLVADTVRAAVVEAGARPRDSADTEPHLAALAAAGADLGADPAAWMAIEVSVEAAPASRSGPSPPPRRRGRLARRARTGPRRGGHLLRPDPRALRVGGRDAGTTSRPFPSPSPPGRASLGARSSATAHGPSWPWTPAASIALIDRWRDLPKNRRRPFTTTQRDGWAEILHPSKQLGLRLDVQELPERIVHAIKA
ncbi:MAG: hypothetical protein IPF99_09350 [Deltaproteobacteria bacterium]|nr:hypothetical protein [Deltaproteobacteria bacterium]